MSAATRRNARTRRRDRYMEAAIIQHQIDMDKAARFNRIREAVTRGNCYILSSNDLCRVFMLTLECEDVNTFAIDQGGGMFSRKCVHNDFRDKYDREIM